MADAGETGPFRSCVRPTGDAASAQQDRCQIEQALVTSYAKRALAIGPALSAPSPPPSTRSRDRLPGRGEPGRGRVHPVTRALDPDGQRRSPGQPGLVARRPAVACPGKYRFGATPARVVRL